MGLEVAFGLVLAMILLPVLVDFGRFVVAGIKAGRGKQ